MKFSVRSAIVLLLKLLLVVGVFYWLARKDLIHADVFERAWGRRSLLGAGLLIMVAGSFLSMARWQLLLRSQSLRLGHPRVLQLHLIGNFFNVCFPGAVSGDFVKAFYVARELPGARGRTFGTILFDRIVGVSALALVSLGAILLEYEQFRGTVALRGIQTAVLLAGAGVGFFYGYLFLVKEDHDPLLKLFLALERRQEKFASLVRIYQGVRYYHHRLGIVCLALAISVVIHLCAGYAIFVFLRALGVETIRLGQVYALAPLGFLVTAIPVLPGGVGTGHAAFGFLFKLIGSTEGANAFTFSVIAQLIIGAVGGLIYLRFKAADPTAQLSHLQQAEEAEQKAKQLAETNDG